MFPCISLLVAPSVLVVTRILVVVLSAIHFPFRASLYKFSP